MSFIPKIVEPDGELRNPLKEETEDNTVNMNKPTWFNDRTEWVTNQARTELLKSAGLI